MPAIQKLINDSQQQHQRYFELYGAQPANGDGFRELADSTRQLVEQIIDTRGDVQALKFSTAVEGLFDAATADDHRPVITSLHVSQAAATATDTSAQVNRDGALAVLESWQGEINKIQAIPDPDSPEGQAAILNIIADHQTRSAGTVADSAAAQRAAGAQAAASADATGGGAGGSSTAALGAMLPALASALAAAPQALTTLLPAFAAAAAAAPAAALAAARQPAAAHQTAPLASNGPPAHSSGAGRPAAGSSAAAGAGAGGVLPSNPPPPATGQTERPGAVTLVSATQQGRNPMGPAAPIMQPPLIAQTPTSPAGGPTASKAKVQLAGFGTEEHPPLTPPPPDPPHGHDPRYWLDTKQILTLPPGQLPPAGYKQIGPGMYYPSTDPGLFVTPPPPPAQLPVDMNDILHLPPGELPPAGGYREVAPGTYFPVPQGADVPGSWPTPKQPIDVRDIIHLKPGELLPSPGYVEFAPGWYAPNINSPSISGGPR